MSEKQLRVILALGTTQTLAWASSYYLPAMGSYVLMVSSGLSLLALFALGMLRVTRFDPTAAEIVSTR